MRTIELKLYFFKELSPEVQQKVLNKFAHINTEEDWWEFVYEDAANIGLKITGFDLDRANYCKGTFIESSIKTANNILSGEYQHSKECDTYIVATKFLNELRAIEDSEEEEEHIDTSDIENEFLEDLLNCYKKSLQEEIEYKSSKGAIIETIEANDYEFTEDGKKY